VVDESLVVDSSDMPSFAKAFDQAVGGRVSLGLRAPLTSMLEQSPVLVDVRQEVPPIVPWLLRYETDSTARTLTEMIRNTRQDFASAGVHDEAKVALLDEAQRLLDEYLGDGGLISYRTQVIVARKGRG
jgi:hypothetical protein